MSVTKKARAKAKEGRLQEVTRQDHWVAAGCSSAGRLSAVGQALADGAVTQEVLDPLTSANCLWTWSIFLLSSIP
jgi:hypothetical protein